MNKYLYIVLTLLFSYNYISYGQDIDIEDANQLLISKSYTKAIPVFKKLR